MKLSISNIGWSKENDYNIYDLMGKYGFCGVEIAPTRIFSERPYDRLEEASEWAQNIRNDRGLRVSSMQSIWYGRKEKLFGTDKERASLLEYTKQAIEFAKAIDCGNLVFGCPKNRNMPEGVDEDIALEFFKEIGDYAYFHGTVIGIEANPPIYGTNYINDTKSALELIKKVGSKGIKLNLDLGAMIENHENVSTLSGYEGAINHFHISEPGLRPIEHRSLHNDIRNYLDSCGYQGYVSIEVSRQNKINVIEDMMEYVAGVFG